MLKFASLISLVLAQTSTQPIPDRAIANAFIFIFVFALGIPLLCCLVISCFAIRKTMEQNKIRAQIAEIGFNYQRQQLQNGGQSQYQQYQQQYGQPQPVYGQPQPYINQQYVPPK